MEIIDINSKEKHTKLAFLKTKNNFAIEFLSEALKEETDIKKFEELFNRLKKNTDSNNNSRYISDEANNEHGIHTTEDPGNSVVERGNNGGDASLELIYYKRGGGEKPDSPAEAGEKWLGIDKDEGLKSLGKKIVDVAKKYLSIKALKGDGELADKRIIEIKDKGIGIEQRDFANTILKLGGSSKSEKPYVMGHFGFGGSSSFWHCMNGYSLIVSRKVDTDYISFTVVWYNEDESPKYGSYKYFVEEKLPLAINAKDLNLNDFNHGTIIKHFGYDLSKYTGSLGRNSLYTLLQRKMFNTVIPIWYIHKIGKDPKKSFYNRTIKGARAALLGAREEDGRSSLKIDHYEAPTFLKVSNGELGKVSVEYWVAAAKDDKVDNHPLTTYVNISKPIIFTNNGQNQHEESTNFTSKTLDLPFLAHRFVVHINCNDLNKKAKKKLWTSSRDKMRDSFEREQILSVVSEYIKSDDKLKELNERAAEESAKKSSKTQKKELQKLIAKYLKFDSGMMKALVGKTTSGDIKTNIPKVAVDRPNRVRILKEIQLKDPPTFINIINQDNIKFWKTKTRIIKVETDAYSYLQEKSIKIEIGDDLEMISEMSKLKNGRFRFAVRCKDTSRLGNKGEIKVSIVNDDKSINLSSGKTYNVVDIPKEAEGQNAVMPNINPIPVDGKNEANWNMFFENPEHASKFKEEDISYKYIYSNDCLNVYYNTRFAPYVNSNYEVQKKGGNAKSNLFTINYEAFLCTLAYVDYSEIEKSKSDHIIDGLTETQEEQLQKKEVVLKNSAAATGAFHIEQELFKKFND